MKIACVCFNSNLIKSSIQESIVDMLKTNLNKLGTNVSLVLFCENRQNIVKNLIDEKYDMIFCIGDLSTIYNHNIKENFAKIFGDKMQPNMSCKKSLSSFCSKHKTEFGNIEEMEIMLPSKCIPLTDENHYYNGFMYKFENTYITFFPSDEKFAIINFDSFVMPLIKDISPLTKTESVILKCYGLPEKDIKSTLEKYFNNDKLKINISSIRLDSKVTISFEKENEEIVQDDIASICSILKKFTYATEDLSLYDTVSSLLKMQNKTISIVETLTFGIFSKMIGNSAKDVLKVGYVFSDLNKINEILPINLNTIKDYGICSVNSIYEIATSLIDISKSDIGVVILGDENTSDCFVAVGDIEGIHVYKNNISDTTEKIISLSETTAFYLIKKLRENDLTFI